MALVESDDPHAAQSRKGAAVGLVDALVLLDLRRQAIERRESRGGMDRAQAAVDSPRHAEVARRVTPEVARHGKALGEPLIVGRDIAALEAVDELAGVKREALGIAEAADLPLRQRLVDRLDRVEEDRQPVPLRKRGQSDRIAAIDYWMDAEEQRGLRSDAGRHRLGRGGERRLVNLAEARLE